MDVREKLEVIAHIGDHITYNEDVGICYDSALAKVIEDAYMELKNGVTVQKWIPVTERLPEKAADYLCRCTVNDFDDMPFYMVLRYIVYDKNPHFQHETKGGMKVTHWMPLPEPPKGE